MKTFEQWYVEDAGPAIKDLPEVAVRSIFEAGQKNPRKEKLSEMVDYLFIPGCGNEAVAWDAVNQKRLTRAKSIKFD
jgi:hypothetical protein